MKIRAVTLGMDLPVAEVPAEPFETAARFLAEAREVFDALGIEVQTTRVAGPSLGPTLAQLADEQAVRSWARAVEGRARDAGLGYISLGAVPAQHTEAVAHLVAPILAEGEIGFLSADLLLGGVPHLPMAAACARAVRDLAATTPLGFGNLRFAATASCPPNIPFLPAAYHAGGPPRFAVAVQAADLVLNALTAAGSVAEIEERLVQALEEAAQPIEIAAARLAERAGYSFVGIDLSPAPFPAEAESIGGAIEAAGVSRFGAPGTLYVAALVTRAIRRTRLQRSGFSGLMLPLLEDAVLARRNAERTLSLHELLLYSAVCGTGLDTVPLPGNLSEAALAGIYLDVAALSVALQGKPLTVRLLPVPGSVAGDETTYTFEFFANTRVPEFEDAGAAGLLARVGILPVGAQPPPGR